MLVLRKAHTQFAYLLPWHKYQISLTQLQHLYLHVIFLQGPQFACFNSWFVLISDGDTKTS